MNNKVKLILTLSLLASIVLVGCGTQAEPTEANAPQGTDPQDVPTEMTEPEPTQAPTDAPVEAEEPAPTEAPAEASADVSFANDVLPIIESRCVKCHGGDRIEEGLLMRTYDEILAGSDNGPIVVPGDVEGSLMVELVTSKEMPKRGPKLTPPQVQIITNWVAAGAPNN